MLQPYSLFSHLHEGLIDALTSPTHTHTPHPHTHSSRSGLHVPPPPSFLHAHMSPTTSRLPLIQHSVCQAQGLWTTPLPTLYLQALLWL